MPAGSAVPALICVAGGDVTGDFCAFFQIAADDDVGRRRAGSVALLEAAIAAVEARDHLVVPIAGRRLGIDQGLRLVAPLLTFIGITDTAQKMQRAENF